MLISTLFDDDAHRSSMNSGRSVVYQPLMRTPLPSTLCYIVAKTRKSQIATKTTDAAGARMILLASLMKTISLTQLLSSCMDASRQGCEVSLKCNIDFIWGLLDYASRKMYSQTLVVFLICLDRSFKTFIGRPLVEMVSLEH
jgi:hypothetical protein